MSGVDETEAAFDGQVAIVTGAGSGIGRAIATSLGRRGAKVVVTDVDEARAGEVTAELAGAGVAATSLRCDVTRRADLAAARDLALAEWGRVDIVVNNVGVLAVGRPEAIPLEEWERVLDINFMSVVRSNDVFLPGLIAQGSGHIVNTASVSGLLNFSHDRLPYASSKAAVITLSEGLRIDLARHGVGVTCLCPAGVITNILEQMRFYGEQAPVTTPSLELVEPGVVGEAVARAIEANRFLVFTDDHAYDLLREKAQDVDRYLDRRIADLAASEASTSE